MTSVHAIVKNMITFGVALLFGHLAFGAPLSSADFAQEKTEAPAAYVAPNEFDNYLQFRDVPRAAGQGPTAVVAVGTFRAFNTVGLLERDVLITFDYAPGVADFNRALAKLIARYDRRELLLLLAGVAPDKVPAGPGEREVMHRLLTERKSAKIDFSTALKESGVDARAAADPELRAVLEHLNTTARSGNNLWMNAIIEYVSTAERFASTILGNERAYKHARAVIEGGRFFAVTGSLSGGLALAKIGEALRARGIVVSEFDISNALEHVLRNDGAKGMIAFAKNLAALPARATSRVLVTGYLRTTEHGDIQSRLPTVGWWSYGTFEVGDFGRAMQTVRTEPSLFQAYGTLAPSRCRMMLSPQ